MHLFRQFSGGRKAVKWPLLAFIIALSSLMLLIQPMLSVKAALQAIYYTDSSAEKIFRADADGSNAVELYDAGINGNIRALAIDFSQNIIFWSETANANQRIRRGTLGANSITDITTIVTGVQSYGLVLDTSDKYLYYTDALQERIVRVEYNGANPIVFLMAGLNVNIRALAIDFNSNTVFWSETANSRQLIQRGTLGLSSITSPTTLVTGVRSYGITTDSANSRIFFTDQLAGTVRRISYTGANSQTIATTANSIPTGINTDLPTLYWGQSGAGFLNLSRGALAGDENSFSSSGTIVSSIENYAIILDINTPPTITGPANQTILEDSDTGALAVTVGDAETLATNLSLTGVSNNQAIIPDANIAWGGAGENRTVTITPNADQFGGPVTITLTVSDGQLQAQASFTVTVTAVNDAPTFAASNPPTVLEDAPAQSIPNWAVFSAGPANESGQAVVAYTVSNVTNAALFSSAPAVANNGTLTYTPAANAFGTSDFTVIVQDDGGTANGGIDTSAPQTFTITITGVNDAPTFAASNPPTILEDAPAQTIANWAVFSAGPANESGQAVVAYTVSNITNAALFSSAPAVANNGTLTYTPAANAFGTSQFTVIVQDDGGTANGGIDTSAPQTFTITITGVNDAPTFAASNPPTILEDAGLQTIPNWAVFSAGPTNESGQAVVAYMVSNITNAALFSVAPAVANNGTLTYTPAANAFGTSDFTVIVQDDGGTANGGVDTSAPQTFTITITGVNDAPTFAASPPPTILEDAPAQSIPNWAVFSPGPANESGQTVAAYTVSNITNAALFSSAPAVANNGTLTYTPAANAFGTSDFTVIVQDDGGTANGGVDTSAPQTFTITITGVNDAPTFAASNPPTILEDAPAQTIPNWAVFSAGPANESGQTVVAYTVSNITNAALFAVAPAVANNGTLTYTPAANAFGTSDFTVIVQDDGGTANGGIDTSAPQTFTITITGVNDAPTFAASNPPTVLEDAGLQTIPNWAVFSAGPANESGQAVLAYTVSNITNAALFSVAPAVANNSTLTYTPAANAFGTSQFTVRVRDNGGTTNGGIDTSAPQTFTITITAVNDAPSFTAANPPTVLEDAPAQTIPNWAVFSPGPANESGQAVLAYTVSNITNAALFSVAPAVANNGTLTYTPAANAFGTSQFTVRVRDNGGTANGGIDTSAPQTFTITITGVNDAPSFTGGSDVISNRNAPPQSFPTWATNISAGPPNEASQSLFFSVIIYNTIGSLTFSSAPAINPNTGTLSYTSAANTGGTAYVAVFLSDSGGTANGGIQTTTTPYLFTITVREPNAHIWLDAPNEGAEVPASFSLVGWALDAGLGAGNGVGIDQIDVYQGASCAGTLLTQGVPNIARTDIQTLFGLDASYQNSGFSIPINTMPSGALTFTVCARTLIDGSYAAQVTRNVIIKWLPAVLLSVEQPAASSTTSTSYTLSGWSLDLNAGLGNGTGVDLVRVFNGQTCAGDVVGDATLGIARPDVQGYFGLDASYLNSGYSLNITSTIGTKTYTICARSVADGTFSAQVTLTFYASGWVNGLETLELDGFSRDSFSDLSDLSPLEGLEPEDQAPQPD